MATHSGLLAWRIIWTEKPRRHRVTESDMTEATSHTHTHTLSTLTQRTVSGNLCCHHPLPYVAPGIQVDVVEFQPLAMAEGPWCWDWMPTPKCPSIKQLEPPIRLMSTSLLVYLETSELAEYTPLRLWSLSGPLTKPLSSNMKSSTWGVRGMETPYSSSLGEEGPYLYLLPRSFFLTLPVTKHSKKRSSSV